MRWNTGGPGQDGRRGWDNETIAATMGGLAILGVGLSYASVPLYRMFCQATGFGGTVRTAKDGTDAGGGGTSHLPKDPASLPRNRPIKVTFNTDTASNLPWRFRPAQPSVTLRAGETALCFFRATNLSDEAIVGVATYNITPMRAGQYFNKVRPARGPLRGRWAAAPAMRGLTAVRTSHARCGRLPPGAVLLL